VIDDSKNPTQNRVYTPNNHNDKYGYWMQLSTLLKFMGYIISLCANQSNGLRVLILSL